MFDMRLELVLLSSAPLIPPPRSTTREFTGWWYRWRVEVIVNCRNNGGFFTLSAKMADTSRVDKRVLVNKRYRPYISPKQIEISVEEKMSSLLSREVKLPLGYVGSEALCVAVPSLSRFSLYLMCRESLRAIAQGLGYGRL
jgi:hypothetical protein